MSRNPLIIKCDMYEEELMEIDSSGFEEIGSITLILINKYQIRQTLLNGGDPIIVLNTITRTSDTISQEIQRLCSEDFTEYWVGRLFHNLGVNASIIDQVKTGIVSRAVDIAIYKRDRGLKQFGLVANIEVTNIRETVQQRNVVLPPRSMREQRVRRRRLQVLIASREQELLRRREQELLRQREQELLIRRRVSIASREQELLQWVLLQSMEERKSKWKPASKSSIAKLKRGHFESGGVGGVMKNCAVCLDDFEIGSKVIWMPCSHMFHEEGCLLPWLKKSKSCPLCRLELTD